MDPHLVPLLENPTTLRPSTLPRRTGPTRFTSCQSSEKLSIKILADQLRLSPIVISTQMLAIPDSISDGGRIALVPVEPSQAKGLYEAIVESTAELSPWMEWVHPDYSIEDTDRWVAH